MTKRITFLSAVLFIVTACTVTLVAKWTVNHSSDSYRAQSSMYIDSSRHIIHTLRDANGFTRLTRLDLTGAELDTATLEGLSDTPDEAQFYRSGDGQLIASFDSEVGLSVVKVENDFSVPWALLDFVPADTAGLALNFEALAVDPQTQRFAVAFSQFDAEGVGNLLLVEFSAAGELLNETGFSTANWEKAVSLNYLSTGLLVSTSLLSRSYVRVLDTEFSLISEAELGRFRATDGDTIAVLESDGDQTLVLYDTDFVELWRTVILDAETESGVFNSITMTDSGIYVTGTNNGTPDKRAQLLVKAFDFSGEHLWDYKPEFELAPTIGLVQRELEVTPVTVNQTSDHHVVVSFEHFTQVTTANVGSEDDMATVEAERVITYSNRHHFINAEGELAKKATETSYKVTQDCEFFRPPFSCVTKSQKPGNRAILDVAPADDGGIVVLSKQSGYEANYQDQLIHY